MKDRLTFLHFLYFDTSIVNMAEARVTNMEYETTRIIGLTKNDRRKSLAVIYNKFVHMLPLEIPNKKKSNFTMRKA